MTKSKGLKTNSNYLHESNYVDYTISESLLDSKYIYLGRLNYESGILEIIDLFQEFTLINNQQMVIHMKEFLKKVTKKLQLSSSKNIIL